MSRDHSTDPTKPVHFETPSNFAEVGVSTLDPHRRQAEINARLQDWLSHPKRVRLLVILQLRQRAEQYTQALLVGGGPASEPLRVYFTQEAKGATSAADLLESVEKAAQ